MFFNRDCLIVVVVALTGRINPAAWVKPSGKEEERTSEEVLSYLHLFSLSLSNISESMSIKFQAVRFSASGRKCPSRQEMNSRHTAHASRCMSYRL